MEIEKNKADTIMYKNSKNIVFIMLHIPNPRLNKRISVAKVSGNTSVICVRRTKQNIWKPYHLDVSHYIYDMDLPTSDSPIKRFLCTKKLTGFVINHLIELKPNILYCEGLDTLLLAYKYCRKNGKCKIVYEVADLRECFIVDKEKLKNRIVASALKVIEKKCFSIVDKLVITSEKFFDLHFSQLISRENTLFLPNIPNPSLFYNYIPKSEGTFTVGFIGGIRYLDQMKLLVDAGEETEIDVIFAGAGDSDNELQNIVTYCKNKNFVRFSGKYNYEEEIAGLYSQVDAVYAVYNAANPNVRIALPNKLYESILCELPIIVAKNTYLADLVEAWGIGIAVECESKEELKAGILKLKTDKKFVESIRNSCKEKKNIINFEVQNRYLRELFE